ncbi:MAG: hypothetical protein K6A97_08145 [Lachnospiraceae bacterium]|nr:hypothetical protein [Lachnospiraceae bacterium]
MTTREALEALLPSYRTYYNIISENVTQPFDAEAVFNSHNEQYYLVKKAKVADVDSNEFVFFKTVDVLDKETYEILDKTAWEEGIKRVEPSFGHKNSDVTLVIIADRINVDCFERIKRAHHYTSYCFSLKGYSNFRVVALELKLKRLACNRRGKELRKMFLQYL